MAKKKDDQIKIQKETEDRMVYLTITGKYFDPGKAGKYLNLSPDDWGILGEKRDNGRKCKQGYFTLYGGPCHWKHETQIKNILKRILPVKKKLVKLLKEDKTITRAYLMLVISPPKGLYNAGYCFDANLLNEFTSIGIDIALSIHVSSEWEKILTEYNKKEKLKSKKKK